MQPSLSGRKLPFFETRLCTERLVCVICRDPGAGGNAFRKSLVSKGDAETVDFDCPIGKPWKRPGEDSAAPIISPDKPRDTQPQQAASMAAEQAAHPKLAICRACEHHTDHRVFGVTLTVCGRLLVDAFTSRKQCGCIMDIKARLPGATCPLGKW